MKNLNAQTNATVVFNYDVDGNRTSLNYVIIRVEEDLESVLEGVDKDLSTNNDDIFGEINLNVYPNPTSGYLVLSSNSQDQVQDVKAKLLSLRGDVVEERVISTGDTEFNLSSYPAGIYFLSIEFNGEKQLYKIIKN